MNLKKNLFLIVWGVIIAVLLCACGYLLYRERSAFVQAKQDLEKAELSLEALNRRNPFPSRANVAITETNLVLLDHVFGDVLNHLRESQVEEQSMEGVHFNNMLEETLGRLNEHAVDYEVRVPPEFAFGFDSYAKGTIPERDDVPRLSVQLHLADVLAELLFSNRVTYISSLTRSVFEEGGGGASAGGFADGGFNMFSAMGMGEAPAATDVQEESHLYSIEHFDIVFMAKGPNVANILRSLAGSRPFAVVTDLNVGSAAGQAGVSAVRTPSPSAFGNMGLPPDMAGMGLPPGMVERMGLSSAGSRRTRATGAPDAGRAYRLREDRTVAGEEILQVTLGMDIYRFKDPRAVEIDPDSPEAGLPDPEMNMPSGEDTPPVADPEDEMLEGMET